VKLYADFSSDPTVTYAIVPAVRSPDRACVDESNCDYEKVTLCAFEQCDTATKVSFLACMDTTRAISALKAATTCATSASLSMSAITTCYNGAEGEALLQTASDTFNGKLPGSTTIPHTFVNDLDVSPSYSSIKSTLCKAGSSASVCKTQESAPITFDTI